MPSLVVVPAQLLSAVLSTDSLQARLLAQVLTTGEGTNAVGGAATVASLVVVPAVVLSTVLPTDSLQAGWLVLVFIRREDPVVLTVRAVARRRPEAQLVPSQSCRRSRSTHGSPERVFVRHERQSGGRGVSAAAYAGSSASTRV
ncbi:hypothetical protein [Kribbella pratensis]|uniref:hypothetical protein n=1 Tax=Kribbella pratensis TaxID=2512112 RepID=UPI001065FBBA|nr:hypothetical protein [Kribbella pratensis]